MDRRDNGVHAIVAIIAGRQEFNSFARIKFLRFNNNLIEKKNTF